MFMYLLTGGILSTIAFSFYVTFHPGMQGIAFRPDDTGTTHFTPMNLIRVMGSPFHDSNFWKLNLLDTNYVVWLIGGTSVFTLIKNNFNTTLPSNN